MTFSTSVSSSNILLGLTSAKILLSNFYGLGPTTDRKVDRLCCRHSPLPLLYIYIYIHIGLKVLSQSLYGIRVEILYTPQESHSCRQFMSHLHRSNATPPLTTRQWLTIVLYNTVQQLYIRFNRLYESSWNLHVGYYKY